MQRRQFITGAAAAAAVAATTTSGVTKAAEFEWKMVTSLPVGLPGPGVSADRFAERVTQMSGGRLSVKVYGAGQLVPAFGTQDAVENGVAEMYHGSGSWFAGRDLAHTFFGVVPFGPDVREFNAWLRFGGGQALWDEFTAPRGLKCFAGGGSGVQTAGWFKEPINSLADMQGKNFRITGLGAKVMQKIGANPISLPPGEIFPALQAGTLDGAEWVGPSFDLAFGFHKILKHMYTPSFSDIYGGMEFGINMDAWNALPADLQTVVQTCADAEMEISTSDSYYANVVALKKLEGLGVEVKPLPDDVWEALTNATTEVLQEARDSSELVARIHDSMFDFLKESVDYRNLYDLPLMQKKASYFA